MFYLVVVLLLGILKINGKVRRGWDIVGRGYGVDVIDSF